MTRNRGDDCELWSHIKKDSKELQIDTVDLREQKKGKVVARERLPLPNVPPHKNFGVEFITRRKNSGVKISEHIDLHGYTKNEAEVVLRNFLRKNQILQSEWVKIITGKSGVLFAYVPILLKELSVFVSRYKYAPPKDGGIGAIYAKIRKIKQKF